MIPPCANTRRLSAKARQRFGDAPFKNGNHKREGTIFSSDEQTAVKRVQARLRLFGQWPFCHFFGLSVRSLNDR